MRCTCCNKNLNDFESTLRDSNGDFLDACRTCLKGLGIASVARPDLVEDEAAPADWFDVGEPLLDPIEPPFDFDEE